MDYRSAKTRFEQTSKDLADLVDFGSDLATLAKHTELHVLILLPVSVSGFEMNNHLSNENQSLC